MKEGVLKSTIQIKVRFNECDPLQVVWHGNYLKYFEDAREDFCSNHGFSYQDVREKGLSTPVVKFMCEHKLPLKYGDKFSVETTFVPTPAAKLVFHYRIFKSEKLVCTGETVQVFLDEHGDLVLNNPLFYIDWKKEMGIE